MAGSKKLPENFRSRFQKMLGEAELSEYEECLQRPMEHGLRVNTLRMTPEEFAKFYPLLSGTKSAETGPESIPWCKSGIYLDDPAERKTEEGAEGASTFLAPSKHPLYYAGAYYLQEPSAMLPAAALPIEPGDRVLDLCAAPGGKSTALAEKLKGTGLLVSNDISASRAKALIKNLELFGVENAVVTAETPERLALHFPDYFDKILIDAPCSGEGMFRKSTAMINDWTEEKTREYAALQREIVEYALRMLRPGGMLLYSTCTYAPEEDEGTVAYILSNPNAREKGLRLARIPMHPGFVPGNESWLSREFYSTIGVDPKDPDFAELLKDLPNTVHLYPHRLRGEGHFAALFMSGEDVSGTEDKEQSTQPDSQKQFENLRKKCPEFAEFARLIHRGFDPSRLKLSQGYLTYLPEAKPQKRVHDSSGNPSQKSGSLERSLSGLRVLRSGLFLGEIKKNRFEPSQALAMTLTPETFQNALRLTPDDPRVIKYLRGETLETEPGEAEDGWVLVTIEELPLGFAKAKNGMLKNKLLPGWRMN